MPDSPTAVTHDQLLRAIDALIDRIEPVERALAAQLRPLLDDTLSVVFYDLTTIRTYGTGTVEDDMRAFGLSKDTSGIDRQFVLGVIQTAVRIRAHALICFLALVLYRVMRQRLRASHSSLSPRGALALLCQLQQHHVLINQTRVTGTGRVTAEQRDLFNALDVSAPAIDTTL